MSRQNKTSLDETIAVQRPLHEVFAYLADFSRVAEWDPAVSNAIKLTDGAPGVGTEYQVVMRSGLKLKYTVVGFEENSRIEMSVESRLFTASEEISFEFSNDRSQVRYRADFDFVAPLATVIRVYPGGLERIGKNAMAGLKKALEDDFDEPRPSALLAASDRWVLPGIWRFTSLGFRATRKRWNAVSAYQANRHALITGATSGIGLAAARRLAESGARITIVGRDEQKLQRVVAGLIKDTGNSQIRSEIADLSLMSDVHALCDRLLDANEPVDMLINNAGALFNPRQLTAEGLERSFALLLLSPYILTERLYGLLQMSSSARVVNVLSGGMYTQRIRVRDLQSQRGTYSGSVAYARAKRGLMILTEEWADRWRDEGVVVNAMHPGWVDTPGVANALPGFYRATRRLLRTPEEGADTAVWLATSSEAGKVSGKFWLDRELHPSHISDKTQESPEDRKTLLEVLKELAQPGDLLNDSRKDVNKQV